MNRWIQSLSCIGLLTLGSSLFGWGNTSSAPVEPPPATPDLKTHFPLADNEEWFVKEAYLLLKPYEDDTDYASRLKTEGSLTSNLKMTMKLQKPDFDWYSGARIGVGRYLPNHDKWDISFYTTYFYAHEKSNSNPDRAKNTLLTPLWIPTFAGGATHGKVVWRLNFFNWDLSAGRQFSLLKTIIAHPFIGLRAALIYKKYRSSYSDTFISGNTNRRLHDSFKASDTFWGIGPRAGVDFQFNFQPGWSFLGNLSAALFYGNYNVNENTSSFVIDSGTPATLKYHNIDERYCVRANLDTALGLGWEAWLKNHTVRVAPSILFEASCWFDTNQFFISRSSTGTVTPASSLPPFQNFRRQGNLILMGLSFNLQTDF